MKKKIFGVLLLIFISMVFFSCSPANPIEITAYANSEYGGAVLIKQEKISEDKRIYYFKDSQYGFEYQITSYMREIVCDGAVLGEIESKESTFDEEYYDYILSQIEDELTELEAVYGVDIQTDNSANYYYPREVYYLSDDTDSAPEVSAEVQKLFESYDTREYWLYKDTYVYDMYENEIGCYSAEYDMWMTPEMRTEYFYWEKAKEYNENAVYIGKEKMRLSETGIAVGDATQVEDNYNPNADTWVMCYYFEADGKEFFVTNIQTQPESNTVEFYNNYREVFGDKIK